jgi:two-component system, sensor histidine kinase
MGETERVEAYVHPMWRPSAFADSRTARRLAVVVSLAIFYFIAGKIGLRFATFHPSTTAIWAPTGISLAGALVFGYWVWPGIFAGAFLVNLTTAGSLATSLGIATGNTLEALVGAYLINRFAGGRNTFYRTQNVFKFFFLAVIISTALAATIGVTSLCLGGYASWSHCHWIWLTWWLGDACGDMIVAPFLILWCTNPRLHWSHTKAMEAVLLLVSLAVVGNLVFGGWLPVAIQRYPLNFLFVPLLLWAAFRLGLRETATATLILSGLALAGTLHGLGPFAQGTRYEALMFLQAFVGVIGFMSLAVASEVSQRPRLDEAQAEADKALSMLRRLQMVTDVALFQETRETLLHELLDRLRSALDSDTATVLLLGPDGVHLSPFSSAGLREELHENIQIPLGQGAAGRIATRDEGLIFNDLTAIDVISPFLRQKVKSLIGSPLKIEGRLIGVIHAGSTRPREYTVDDLDLIRRVAQRAALAIERTQLLERERSSREAAEAANHAKDEFLAMLGHELRNPLAAISMAVNLLTRADARRDLEPQTYAIIVRQVERLLRLVDDLLDVARVTTRKIQLRRQPTNIAECITGCIKQLTATKQLEDLHILVEAEPVWVDGDPDRVAQIVINLVSNAVKYTPSGGSILVSTAAEDEYAVIRVKDTGVGIPAGLLPRIFDLFVQGEVELDRAHAGLGVGLTLVRRLAELHDGTAEASSEGPGQGSTFIVRLPRIAAPVSTVGQFSSGPDAAKTPRRILIIEDNTDVRESLRALLELSGYEVYEAPDGPSGVEKAVAVRPDIALIDIGLPGLDGYDVARRIRSMPDSRGIVLVALTGYAQPEYRERADQVGFDGYLAKPIDVSQLSELIETLLRTA